MCGAIIVRGKYDYLNKKLNHSYSLPHTSGLDDKTKLQALFLANECNKYKMGLVTNCTIITDALKFVEKNHAAYDLSEIRYSQT